MRFNRLWNQGIYRQILYVSLIPAVLLGISLIIYLVTARLGDLEESFNQRGQAVARQIASVSQYGIFSGNSEPIELAINVIQSSNPDVYQIQVLDETGAIFVDNSLYAHSADRKKIFRSIIQLTQAQDDPNVLFFSGEDVSTEQGQTDQLGTVIVHISTSRLQKAKTEILQRAIIILLLGFVATLFLARAFATRIARPIEELTEAVGKVRSGQLETHISVSANGEIGKLEDSFNAMTNELVSANDQMVQQIDQATVDLKQTLETLEIQNVKIDLSRKRAIEANRVKSEFLANMSHEIRTPMNGIAGFVELLTQTNLSPKQKEYLDTINTSTKNLLGIINEILDFSKLDSGKLKLNEEPFDLRDLVENAMDLLSHQAHHKGLELVSLVSEDVDNQLIGDPIRIRQILVNLISNAIKFTDQGDVIIRVMSEEIDNSIRLLITVSDTGSGIPEKDQEILFNPFAQGSMNRKQAHQGTGLGLSICRQLTEAMSGGISVRSLEGQGSTFHVNIRLRKDPEQPLSQGYGFSHQEIILLDSHLLSHKSLKQQLNHMGLKVHSLTQWPARFPSSLSKTKLILLSLTEGDVSSSQQLIQKIKKDSRQPVICLLSSSDPKHHQMLVDFGAESAQLKPIRSTLLSNMLLQIISQDDDLESQEKNKTLPDKDSEQKQFNGNQKILVVDDNEINSRLMKAILDSKNMHVSIAHNGIEAIQQTKRKLFDLIFMDIHMPNMGGETAARHIRRQAAYTEIPIIALTADVTQQDKLEKDGHPFNDNLIKPLEQKQLDILLDRYLSATEHHEAVSQQEQAEVSPPKIRDQEVAIGVSAGSRELADKLFMQFADELPDAIKSLEEDLQNQDLTSMWEDVHRLQGGSAATATVAMHKALDELQRLIKASDFDGTEMQLKNVQAESLRILEYKEQISGS